MKIGISFVVFCYLIATYASFAEELKNKIPSTFKCHIETANGPNLAFFSWNPDLLIQEQSSLLASYVATVTNERLMVKRVVECIAEDKSFSSKIARKLDKDLTK